MNPALQTDPWTAVANLSASVTMELDVPQFTVTELMKLGPGSVLSTTWPTNRDLPLRVNGRLLGWAEFEITGNNVGVRVTEFAWEQPQVLALGPLAWQEWMKAGLRFVQELFPRPKVMQLSVEKSVSLAQKANAVLLLAHGERLLLGVTANSVSVLRRWSDKEETMEIRGCVR